MAQKHSQYSVAHVPKRKRSRALLPVLGILLAVCLAGVAYVAAPQLVKFGEDQNTRLARQFAEFRFDYGENSLDYIAAGLLWLVMLGISALVVSAFVGEDPDKEAFKHMGPSPANKKAMAKEYKRQLKEREKLARQKKAQLKKRK